jgi:hypothetical protein
LRLGPDTPVCNHACESGIMLHLTKLAVGIRDIEHLRAVQSERARTGPPLRHRTRNQPRRAEDVLGGGSMYWVIGGFLRVRQRILDITEDTWPDGSACAGLMLDPKLVIVSPRPVKPFQGWRYLVASDAPPDVGKAPVLAGVERLPAPLRRELHALCLL